MVISLRSQPTETRQLAEHTSRGDLAEKLGPMEWNAVRRCRVRRRTAIRPSPARPVSQSGRCDASFLSMCKAVCLCRAIHAPSLVRLFWVRVDAQLTHAR